MSDTITDVPRCKGCDAELVWRDCTSCRGEGGYWEPNTFERVQWEECVGCYGTEGRFVCVNPECES